MFSNTSNNIHSYDDVIFTPKKKDFNAEEIDWESG